MQILSKTLPDDHNIFHFGDKHDGSCLSTNHGWNIMVDLMHSKYDGCKNNYGIDGGDQVEAILVDDKRFSKEKLKEKLPLAQRKQAIKIREPIKDILLSILLGNHERALWSYGDLSEDIADELGVPYGTYSCKINVLDKKGNLMYKIFETHGTKGITSTADDPKRRKVNMQLILKRQLKFKAGDCAVMVKHHTHKLLVAAPEKELYLKDDGKEIKQGYTSYEQMGEYIHPDARWYGNAGSFLRLYGSGISGYAEIFEYDPVELGFLILKVRDRKIISLEPYYLQI